MANRNFARSMRRKTQWGGFGNAAGAAALPVHVAMTAGTPVILSQGVVVQGALGVGSEVVTLVRTIGQFSANLNLGTANLDGTVAVGCIVARDEAVAAGVGSLPSPEDDPDSDWLYYGVFGLHNAVSGQLSDESHVRQDFDVRGQRISKNGETVVWLAESQTSDVDAMVGGRYLFKLP